MPDVGSVTTVLRSVSFSHPNTLVETILVQHTSLTELIDHHLDFSNILESTIIRVFEKADQNNFEQIGESRTFPTDYGTGTKIVRIVLDGAGQDMKITLQSELLEGSVKTIDGTVRDTIRL